MHELRYKRHTNNTALSNTSPSQTRRWPKFQFHGPTVYKITNLFKNINVKVAFKATNTIFHQLTRKPKKDNPPGIYRLCLNTCKRPYVGQTGRDFTTKYKEHVRYIKNNNPVSAYSSHILNNRHEYGSQTSTLKLLKHCQKGSTMNIRESMYIQACGHHDLPVAEQNSTDHNLLFNLARVPCHTDT
jgi:hypothetical protein